MTVLTDLLATVAPFGIDRDRLLGMTVAEILDVVHPDQTPDEFEAKARAPLAVYLDHDEPVPAWLPADVTVWRAPKPGTGPRYELAHEGQWSVDVFPDEPPVMTGPPEDISGPWRRPSVAADGVDYENGPLPVSPPFRLHGRLWPGAVDPAGCGCTECLTGEYVPEDQAIPEVMRRLEVGLIADHR